MGADLDYEKAYRDWKVAKQQVARANDRLEQSSSKLEGVQSEIRRVNGVIGQTEVTYNQKKADRFDRLFYVAMSAG